MGVLNVTPDSFSDAGNFAAPDAAIAQAVHMASAGADLIDVGGESTRPGSDPVPADEQIRRVVPVIAAAARQLSDVTISIDTMLSQVARAALEAGAQIINDISAARTDNQMLPLAAKHRAPIVLMHMQGTPKTMQDSPSYANVVQAVVDFLRQRIAAAVDAGVSEQNILIDPGIGFGKTMEHNLTLLRDLRPIADAVARPMVVGTSRKGFVGRITNEPEPAKRLFGTAATVAWSVANGAAIVRVHDVGPMSQVVRMIRAIQSPGDAADSLTV
jgi:dihydropteroate synthase